MRKAGFVFLAAVGLLGFGALASRARLQCVAPVPFQEASTAVSGPAPAFSLQDLDQHEITLSQLRGKVVLVNIWATWLSRCP
jgi:cytochrome oxidase Cu insertion factor (SCO1/SenC/PrrC family)